MLNPISFSLNESLEAAVREAADNWQKEDKIARVWARDATVWSNADEAKWLGWLDIVDEELGGLQKYRDLQADIAQAGFTAVLLMGMGGSSLCPEVLTITFNRPQFRILDSTDPAQVKAVEDALDLEKTLFIVASKSGSTLEPNCFKQYFFDKLADKVGRENAGKQFIAITDPGSKMEQVAKADGFRHIFHGQPSIGGRFSALSVFGMVAAASMGLDVEDFLTRTRDMVAACRNEDPAGNPGAMLGLVLGICQTQGRDKLTIFTSPEIHDLGAWLEQLIAESTGKNGVAIIPVDREPIQAVDVYGDDRVFAYLKLKGSNALDPEVHDIEIAGHPVARIELEAIEDLGQEFFRWEFATAVAGAVMGINPFDQPDVEAAKIEARKLTEEYEKTGSLPDEKPFFEAEGVQLYSSDEYGSELMDAAEEKSLASLLDAHLLNIHDNDYFAVLAYIQMNEENQGLVQEIRENVLGSHAVATCLGFGPRFLHSTGQAYKGGPNSGVFLQITADNPMDLPVPEQKFTFGIVKAAQARGDFQVLLDRGRRALRVHLKGSVPDGLRRIDDALNG
jgi:transaldolase/glucose-6-phosphate isomerase